MIKFGAKCQCGNEKAFIFVLNRVLCEDCYAKFRKEREKRDIMILESI